MHSSLKSQVVNGKKKNNNKVIWSGAVELALYMVPAKNNHRPVITLVKLSFCIVPVSAGIWRGAGEPPETVYRGSEDPSIVTVSTTDIPWAWTNLSFLLLSSLQTVTWWSLTIHLYSVHLPEQGRDFDLNTMVIEMMFCRGAGPHTSAISYSKPIQAVKNNLSPGYHKQGQMMWLRWNKQQSKLEQSLEQNCNIT